MTRSLGTGDLQRLKFNVHQMVDELGSDKALICYVLYNVIGKAMGKFKTFDKDDYLDCIDFITTDRLDRYLVYWQVDSLNPDYIRGMIKRQLGEEKWESLLQG